MLSRPEGVAVACYRGASAVPFCRARTGPDGAFACAPPRPLDDDEDEDDAAAVAAALAAADLRARSSRALRKMAAQGSHGPLLVEDAGTRHKPPPPSRSGGLLSRALRESAERPGRRAAAAAEAWRRELGRTAYCVFSKPGVVETMVSSPFDLVFTRPSFSLDEEDDVNKDGGRGGRSRRSHRRRRRQKQKHHLQAAAVALPPQRLYPDRSRDGVPTNGCGPRVYLAPTGRVNATALAIAQRAAALAELAAAAEAAAEAARSAPPAAPNHPNPRRSLPPAPLPSSLVPIASFRLPRASMPVVDVGGALIPDLAFGASCHSHDACYGTDGESRTGCDEEFEALVLSTCRARALLGSGPTWGGGGGGGAAVADQGAAASSEGSPLPAPEATAAAAVARAAALAGGAAEAEARLMVTGGCARVARTYVAAVRQFGGRSWNMSAHQRRLMSAERAAAAA